VKRVVLNALVFMAAAYAAAFCFSAIVVAPLMARSSAVVMQFVTVGDAGSLIAGQNRNSTIDIFAVADGFDYENSIGPPQPIDDPVRALAYAINVGYALEFQATGRERLGGETLNAGVDLQGVFVRYTS
jgi:hypothetical protein